MALEECGQVRRDVELAERHGTNVRTIRRDLEGLEAVGLPIVEEPGDGKKKRWRVAYKDKLARLADLLEVTHYLALRVARGEALWGLYPPSPATREQHQAWVAAGRPPLE